MDKNLCSEIVNRAGRMALRAALGLPVGLALLLPVPIAVPFAAAAQADNRTPQGFASAHHAISTNDPVSQALFDRGLTLFYAYNGSEGVHVFQSIERREPGLAMAYWGEALSYGSDFNQRLTKANFEAAHAAIEKAAALERGASEAERAYIDAMRLRYGGAWKNHHEAEAAYRDAMASAFVRYPHDDDLGALYVEALLEKNEASPLWKPDTTLPAAGKDTQTMVGVLDEIIARNPDHLLANHLVLHVFELSADRQRALPSAARFDSMPFAPEDEHLAHMAVHAYIRAGLYAKGVAASRRAIALFDQYLATPGIDRAHSSYIWHDIMHGHVAAMMLGDYAQAQWFVTRLKDNPKRSYLAAVTSARFGRWDDVAKTTTKDSADPVHFALALRELHRGEPQRARANLSNALDDKGAMGYLLYALRGAADMQQHKRRDAEANFEKAFALEKKSNPGADIPFFPTSEIKGGAYFREGDYPQAERAYREALDRYPNDARALYGLSQALSRQHKSAEAQTIAAEFVAVWEGSDTTLTPESL